MKVCPPCDQLLDVAQPPIAIAASKGLPVFSTPKHSTKSLRIAATTICLGLRRPRDFTESPAPRSQNYTAWRIGPACIVQREERRCQSWRCVSLDRWTFPTDAAAGSIPHKRPPRRSSAVHLDQAIRPHYASQSLTNAADAQQKIAFRLQVAIIVDRQCDGFVDRSELAREVRDRRIGQGLSLRVDNAAVLAVLPFRQARDDARSDRLQLTQPTVGLRGWCPRRGLEQFTILTNVRRIDPISLVATQLGAHEVSNLGGIDDADNMVGLVQRTRDAETITPGGFQTGVNPLDLLGNQPIQEMAPPIR